MEHIAPIIMAIVAGLGALGAVCKFIWQSITQRFDAIDAKLDLCEEREKEALGRNAIHIAVIELLWAEMKRVRPNSAVLTRAKKLMDHLKIDEG